VLSEQVYQKDLHRSRTYKVQNFSDGKYSDRMLSDSIIGKGLSKEKSSCVLFHSEEKFSNG
jgi:hypothetical protein